MWHPKKCPMYPRQRQCGPVYDFPSSFKVFQQERDKLCISKVATALTRPWFRAAVVLLVFHPAYDNRKALSWTWAHHGTSISGLFQILSTPMATKPLATLVDDQRCCRLCASGSGVATEYKWFGWSVLNCVFGMCRWNHYATPHCVACRRFQQWIPLDQKERTKHGTGCPKETTSLWVMMPAKLYQPSRPRTVSSNEIYTLCFANNLMDSTAAI